MQTERLETIVIGGGQAGLATGYHLARKGQPFAILDASERVGDAWRKRWPSLRLYTPAAFDGLPGMPFPAPRYSYPTAMEMADYLESYAARFDLPVRSGVVVDALERNDEGYVITAGTRRFEADSVVVATGVMQHENPVVPEFAGELDPSIRVLHSADYRSPEQLQEGAVLVVGASHSGGDIAYEVAKAGFPTILSGPDTGHFPLDLEGRGVRLALPVLRLVATRVLTVSTPLGRKVKPEIRSHGGPLLRVKRPALEAAGVELVLDRTVGTRDGKPVLADGRALDVANVVWCTGFRHRYDWIRFEVPVEDDGYPVQVRGAVPSSPGLYFAGMPFLHSFSSMLVLGAGRDGARVAEHIEKRSRSRAKAQSGARPPATEELAT